MEPPQQGTTFDFSQVDAHFQGNTDFENGNPLGRREKLLDIASSFFNYAGDIGSSLWQGATFVYGILVNLLQFTAIAFGILVYVLNEVTFNIAVVLRIVARHCEAGATLLESMHLRSSRGGRFARRPAQVVQSLATARVAHSQTPARSTVRPPIQTIMSADAITVDSQVSENQDADDSMEETEAYEIRYRGVSRGRESGGVESITQTAQRVMTKKKKLTPKQLGRRRIRAYREQRKLKGLKV